MISNKMKEDAAKINSEIKIIATKMPLAFHNYSYLNEDATKVLKRRNEQLDDIKGVKEFLNANATFSDLLNNCGKEFKLINDELRQLGMLDNVSANDSAEESLDSCADSCKVKTANDDSVTMQTEQLEYQRVIQEMSRGNKTISRDNSCIPDTPAIKDRTKLNFARK